MATQDDVRRNALGLPEVLEDDARFAFGIINRGKRKEIAWVWLEQACTARKNARPADTDFYQGKLQACRYFFLWELPKVGPMLDLLESIDTTALDMQDAWF